MSDRIRFNTDTAVTPDLLNECFDQVELADKNLAADLGLFGIVRGFEPRTREFPDMSIQFAGEGLAYDEQGRRIFTASSQPVDCRRDSNGQRTEVLGKDNEAWLLIAATHALDVEDGHHGTPTRSRESSSIHVRRGHEAPRGQADKPLRDANEIVLCHVRLYHGCTSLRQSDIDLSQRQNLTLWRAATVAVEGHDWQKLPSNARLEDVLGRIDTLLAALEANQKALLRQGDWTVLPTCNSVQDAVDQIDAALAWLTSRIDSLVSSSDGWSVLGRASNVQSAFDNVDRILHENIEHLHGVAGNVGALTQRLDALQASTHPAAHRVHENVYYTVGVDVPSLAPKERRIIAVRLEGVASSDKPSFARPTDESLARSVDAHVVQMLDGVARLAITNLTESPLHHGHKMYEIGLWVPEN